MLFCITSQTSPKFLLLYTESIFDYVVANDYFHNKMWVVFMFFPFFKEGFFIITYIGPTRDEEDGEVTNIKGGPKNLRPKFGIFFFWASRLVSIMSYKLKKKSVFFFLIFKFFIVIYLFISKK